MTDTVINTHTGSHPGTHPPHLQRVGDTLIRCPSLCVERYVFNLMASRDHKAQEYTGD